MSIHSPDPEPAIPKNASWDTASVRSRFLIERFFFTAIQVHSDKTVKTMSPVLESKRKTRANEKNTEKEEGVEPKAPPTWACQFTFQNTLVYSFILDDSRY